MGVNSQKKNVDPDWYFISMAYFMMLLSIFGCIGIVILGYNLHTNNISLFGGKNKKVNTIYYDRLNELNEESNMSCLKCLNCCKKKTKVDNETKVDEPIKSHDLDFGYNQMQKLQDDLDTAHDKLNKLMKDRDKKKARENVDEDGNPGDYVPPEDELISELVEFSAFIKAHQECLKDAKFDKPPEGDWFSADEDKDALKAGTVEVIEKKTLLTTFKKGITGMMLKSQ